MRRVAFIALFILLPVATSSYLGTVPKAHGSSVCPAPKDPGPIPIAPPRRAYFDHPQQTFHLKNGQKQVVGLNLTRPASNSKVDVFFIIDATDSMDFAICAVQKAVTTTAQTLANSGLDVQFGLSSFRDYPYLPWGQPKDHPSGYEGDYVYRLERDIGPFNFDFLDALHGIKAAGGGNAPEAGQAALYQALSGKGQTIVPGQISAGDVPSGAGASFRTDALRLIIMSTDQTFVEPPVDSPSDETQVQGKPYELDDSTDGSDLEYPGPPWASVQYWIHKKNVKVASILLGDDGRDSLTKAAIESGALAPPGGAVCSRDFVIPAGQPLVCDATNYGSDPGNFSVGPAITALVQALRDVRQLNYKFTGDTDILGTTPTGGESIDFKHDSTVPFAFTLSCKDHPGIKHLFVTASSGGHDLATSRIDVVCDPKAPVDAGVTITLLKGAAIAPAAQQPAPASNLNPQAAMGMVSQNEQQAAFQQNSADQDPTKMEMSAMPRKRPNGIAPFAVGVALMSAGAAFGLSRKQQGALAKASVKRRKR